jgi:inosose dehydratase
VEVAEILGAKRIFVSVHAGDLDRKIAYQRLRSVGDVAAEAGVIVMLETHPDMATNGDVARRTMEAVNHPNVRINFDTANIYYYNKGVDGVVEMKKVLDFIEGVHLKDTNGKFGRWYFPTLGEGIVDFRQVRELLNGRGFFGPFTIEIEGIKGENLTLEQTLERMEKSVQHLRESGY